VNLATLEMFQAQSKTQLLADLSKVLGPESLTPFKEELLALVRGDRSFENETTNYTLRSERRDIFMRLTVAPGSEQTWDKVFVGISDITERRQIEEALRQSEEKYRSLVERLPAITYISAFDEAKTRLYVSPQNEIYLGFPPDEWLADPELWRNQLHPEHRDRVLAEAAQFYESGEPFISEYCTISRDGRPVWFHDEAVIVRDAQGQPQYIQGIKFNITERKQAEEALSQSEERFRLMAWATTDAVWDWDLQTNQVWWGAGLQKILHYSSSETELTNYEWWSEHIHPEDKYKVDHSINQALEGGMEFWSKEYRFQRVDGTYADIMDRAYIMRDTAGKAYRMVGAMMDITERKQMELTLLQSNEKLGQFLEELQQRNRESALLNELSQLLQGCQSAKEAYGVIAELSKQLFPRTAGALYMLDGTRIRINTIASWGKPSSASDAFTPANCRALRRSPTRPLNSDQPGMCCLHFAQQPGITYCLPIQVQGETLGIFHLQSTSEENLPENKRQLAYTVVEQSEMVLANLKLRQALLEQSIRDPLTGLYNRRYMEEALKQQLSRVTRQLHPLGLIMIDIDHFKNFNDTHGHAAGDALLRELGRLLESHIRGGDVACRYGGEEFLLIMPDASLEAAQQRALLLQKEAKKLRVRDAGQSLDGITLSMGVAIYPEHGRNKDSVLRAADAALYRAKQEGRDRVVVAERAY
jgi:diguanylate cyclase (GGDEF)-like protein/PAS domain S-box-containing protein